MMKKISRRSLLKLPALFLTAALVALSFPMGGMKAFAAKMKGAYFVDGNPPFAYVVTGLKAAEGEDRVKLYQNANMQSYEGYDGVYTIPEQVFDSEDMHYYTVTEIGGSVGDTVPGAMQGVPLRGIDLPGGVTTIGTKAFSGCWNLMEMTFPTSVVSLAPDAFEGVNVQKLTLRVSTSASLSGESFYTPGNSLDPIMLPCPLTDLMVTAPLTITGAVNVSGSTVLSNTSIVVRSGAALTLSGGLSGTGVVEVANGGALTLWGSALSYNGTIRLTGSGSTFTNFTSSPIKVMNCFGRTITLQPGDSVTGNQEEDEENVSPPSGYRPQISTNYGGVVSVEDGGRVVVITPYDGYRVESVEINGILMKDITRYEFETADSQNTVKVTFARGQDVIGPKPSDPISFKDVPATAAYADSVFFLVNNGILQGVSNTRFAPDLLTTRAMYVSLLKRMEIYGSDFRVECELPELPADVDPSAWYAESAAWSVGCGFVSLDNARNFRPNQLVTREEAALYLYRLTLHRGYAAWTEPGSFRRYADSSLLSEESRDALTWAVSRGFLPSSSAMLNPSGLLTRAEVAQMLAQYLQRV